MLLVNVFIPGTIYQCFITVHCTNLPYGTFLHSFSDDIIILSGLRYSVPIANINQLIHPLIFGYQTLFGKLKTDTVDPRTYITAAAFQQQIADIPINLTIDKNLMMCFRLDFDCQLIGFNLFVQQVKKPR